MPSMCPATGSRTILYSVAVNHAFGQTVLQTSQAHAGLQVFSSRSLEQLFGSGGRNLFDVAKEVLPQITFRWPELVPCLWDPPTRFHRFKPKSEAH